MYVLVSGFRQQQWIINFLSHGSLRGMWISRTITWHENEVSMQSNTAVFPNQYLVIKPSDQSSLLWQFERDVMIWNNKKYISKPLLVKEDSAIQKHRRWYSQFYSENSPRLRFQHDTLDFWSDPWSGLKVTFTSDWQWDPGVIEK